MRKPLTSGIILLAIILYCEVSGYGQAEQEKVAGIPVNYDESLTGTYTLPDPLIFQDGSRVKNARQWFSKRRPQILSLFYKYQYGKIPEIPAPLAFNVFDKGTSSLNGTALRKQVAIYLTDDTSKCRMDILIYIPAGATKPVPLFLNVSFSPNAEVVDDPGIRAGYTFDREGRRVQVQRTGRFGRLNPEIFLSKGIGFATICYSEIEPDFAEGLKYGIRGYYLKEGQTYPAPDEWGAISAWSWGLSRAMDYLETDSQIDAKKVALCGSSRLGKTVLWTGCRDTRFGMVIASCSGEGGAALSRRWYGETIDHMTHPSRYFYQFALNWRNYRDDPSLSPVDAHMLIALMAPRPLLLQTGDTDKWSDPKGEFLADVAGGKVYEFLGRKSLQTDTCPPSGTPILNDLGYFMHTGGHGILPSDYDVFVKFMKLRF